MPETQPVNTRETKQGGAVVFVSIFLSPFAGLLAIGLGALASAALDGDSAEAARRFAILPVAAVHWILATLVARRTALALGRNPTVSMIVWGLAAVVADLVVFGAMMTLMRAFEATG